MAKPRQIIFRETGQTAFGKALVVGSKLQLHNHEAVASSIPSPGGSFLDTVYLMTDASLPLVRRIAKREGLTVQRPTRAFTVGRRAPKTNPAQSSARGEIVEVYRGVPIRWTGAGYEPDMVNATGSNVVWPRASTVRAARRLVGIALRRGWKARTRENPALVIMGNPPSRRPWDRAGVLSTDAASLTYTHAADGELYRHKFAKGVTVELLADGSIRLYRPDRKPIWRMFKV